jgi:hypothetical protein
VSNVCRSCEAAERSGKIVNAKKKTRIRDFDKCAVLRIFLQHYKDKKETLTLRKLLSSNKETLHFQGGKTNLLKIIRAI